jgi:UDP-N-acetylmuramate dehydrogenase
MQNEIEGRLLENEPLAKYTSWRVGGQAEQLFFPADRNDLVSFLRILPVGKSVFWMGLGSNLLIRDGGVMGVVINTRGRLKAMHHCEDGTVYVEAGVPCAHVARFCGEQGLTGAEFLAGIPGTMGGALKMNAGAFGGETWNIVNSVEMVNSQGDVIKRHAKDFEIKYRSVTGIENEWFLAVNLQLELGETILSQEKIKILLAKRNLSQPTNQPSCGSVFKNPANDFAARLIEASALKGYRIGGAQVSEKHANFIVNTGSATARDIETLIAYVRDEVEKQQGVDLETEVCIVGQEAQQ